MVGHLVDAMGEPRVGRKDRSLACLLDSSKVSDSVSEWVYSWAVRSVSTTVDVLAFWKAA